jgi:hypothetical protein
VWAAVFVVFVLLVAPLAVFAALVSVAAGSGPDALPGLCGSDVNLDRILATIRALESGGGDPAGDYSAEATGASASGAYQIVDATWGGYGGYRHAADAPPDIQDAKAAEMVDETLDAYHGDVTMVPLSWYWPKALRDPTQLDVVPMPAAGNTLTVGEYQRRWLDTYATVSGSGAGGSICYARAGLGFDGDLPDRLAGCAAAWGGYRNGHIPQSAMRYSPVSGWLHPAASRSFDELYAAAAAAGFDLRGNGYRSATDNGTATRGISCHGAGMAVDIDILVPGPTGPKYDSVAAAFASPEFVWLCANAGRYGWVVPRNAMPVGMRCGGVVGNGAGGCIGESCGHLESWHVEAVGVAATHPDFAATDAAAVASGR